MSPVPDLKVDTLRRYALLADGERGALVGPQGEIAFLCAPAWHDDAVFSQLLGGPGAYLVTPADRHHVWGGHYEPGTLIWRSRWTATRAVIESREALALPTERHRLVLLRRIEALLGDAHVQVALECRAGFGSRAMTFARDAEGVWEGHTGPLRYRWSGAPRHARVADGRLVADISVPEGGHHDLVLEITTEELPEQVDTDEVWRSTERAWGEARPDVTGSAAPGESLHSWAVLRGLTSREGGMVAAATTSLPERAEKGRNYDYRYAWIRDQCYAGVAAAALGDAPLLDAAVGFVTERVLEARDALRPAYRMDGAEVPPERSLSLPGYPGAPVRVGNHARRQFQLDAYGEALVLLAEADRHGRLDTRGMQAIEILVHAVREHAGEPEAGIWELADRRWAHSRLMCAAGLRAVAARRAPDHSLAETRGEAAEWNALAEKLVTAVDEDCLHPSGRWQRAPDDPRVDAALLLPGVRGAVPADDPRYARTVAAVRAKLSDDGYVYRFCQDPGAPLHDAEGAFVLSGFHMALAELARGRRSEAVRWFERNRGSLGPPGLFAEEFDVVQRQLRGNLPQAFVHAAALETAQRLGAAGVEAEGFVAEDR